MSAAAVAGAAGAAGSSAAAWAPAVVGGAMGMASGLFKPSLKRQWKYMQKQMALQQQYALEQMDRQAALNYANWQKQFDYENDYNLPTKIFDRYRAAGVTPAAVLGSSGVGVSGTISPGSVAGTSGASGPSGGSMDFINPMATAGGYALQAMQVKSQMDLNKAMANNQNAQASETINQTQTPELYRSAFIATTDLLNAGVTEKNAQSAWLNAQASFVDLEREWYSLRQNAEIISVQNYAARVQQEIDHLKAMYPVSERYAEAAQVGELSVLFANSYKMLSEAELNRLTGQDVQHWLNVNWKTSFKVQEYDKAGRPIEGKFREMTGEQMAAEVKRLQYEVLSQEPAAKRYEIRSEKNAFGYGVVQSIIHGALGVAGLSLLKGASFKGAAAAGSSAPSLILPNRSDWERGL